MNAVKKEKANKKVKTIKNIFLGLLTGANVLAVVLMLFVGYSDRLNPVSFPLLAWVGMLFPLFILANLLFVPLWVVVKWKRLWIPVVGFLLAYVPIRTYFPINFSSNPPDGCITVVSYNTCGFGGNWKYEYAVDTVADYLRRVNADIVCLQEDHGGKGGSGFDKMKEIYPYNDTIHIYEHSGAINGLGIHTRFPIIRKERIAYESKTNGSMAYYLQMGDDTILVINNHLESTNLTKDERSGYKEVLRGEVEHKEAEAQILNIFKKLGEQMVKRAPEAEAVSRYVEEHRQYPIIVCGDFNDTPISYTRHTIAKHLTDCFVTAGCGPGLSYNQKGFNLRIDHIMCSSEWVPVSCEIDSKMDASDHYPLVCRLKKADNP